MPMLRFFALALLFQANVESRTQLGGGARHGPARLIEELIAAWEAQERAEVALSKLSYPVARGLASTVLAKLRSGDADADFHTTSLNGVLELVPDADAYTFVFADVYAPVSTGATTIADFELLSEMHSPTAKTAAGA